MTSKNKHKNIKEEIEKTVYKILIENNGEIIPTVGLVAKLINRPVKTVRQIIKELKFDPQDYPLKALTPRVLMNLFTLTNRSPKAVELWFKLVENWSDKINVNMQNFPELNFMPDDKNQN